VTDLVTRVSAVRRPAPNPGTVVSVITLLALLVLGIVSFAGLGFSWTSMAQSLDNIPQFFARATPFAWPGYHFDRASASLVWDGWAGVGEFWVAVAVTLGIVIAGTFLAALISIPVAYGAARTTTPNQAVMVICRAIGVVSRSIPAIAFASVFVFLFTLGPLPGILAFMFHSVGMISKMFADAIESVDEGPRIAIRSTGGSRSQEFWSGIVPQVVPAWIAVGLHRADINLRETVILGFVGVAGLGLELSNSIHALNYRRAFPIAIAIIILCVLFEIVSSVVRSRLLGVRPTGMGLGDAIVRSASRRSPAIAAVITKPGVPADRQIVIEAAMKRPWTGERLASTVAITVGAVIIVGAFIGAQARWGDLFTFWGNLPILLGKDNLFPPTFGIYSLEQVGNAILITFQVAFAATLISAVLTTFIGTLAARNVAPGPIVRNTFRGILLVIRGIPELLLAILFVIVSGLGAQAGTLALGIGGVGLLGKLIADSLEEVPNGPEQAVKALGGTRPQVFFASTLPLSVPAFVAHLLYLLEQNVRAATLLGIVGGGGIGLYLYDSLRVSHYDQVTAFLLLIIALVLLIEGAAILIRRALR
jgi:phosphonate transport system permease protein